MATLSRIYASLPIQHFVLSFRDVANIASPAKTEV
jgi:hypothetical protein